MKKIRNEENDWDQTVEIDVLVAEGPMEKVTCNEIAKAMQKMKSRKATRPSKSKCRDDSRK